MPVSLAPAPIVSPMGAMADSTPIVNKVTPKVNSGMPGKNMQIIHAGSGAMVKCGNGITPLAMVYWAVLDTEEALHTGAFS